jgi:ribose transport system ATP-binding protein
VSENEQGPVLQVDGLSGRGFQDISFSARRGEIVGIAGIVGNGQRALLRALAGLDRSSGSVTVGGKSLSRKALLENAAYMPADRLTEGLMVDLNVRENAALTALDLFRTGPFVSRRREIEAVERELSELAVKAPSLESSVSSLSGGNQQKVVMSRAMLSDPAVLVADEPTQGVDVGARAEIYRILREVSARGVPVVVASSDAIELEGLCDRVIVMSRGQTVASLEGEDVTEEKIVHAAISATIHSSEQPGRRSAGTSRFARFVEGDYAPVLVLAAVMIALGAYVWSQNDRYFSDFNITSVMFACAALGFISLGQTFALLLGGIDLSVGPLAGFLVVVASFFVLDGKSTAIWALGFAAMLGCALGVGLLNGSLIRFARFTPVAATLVTYIALGGLAFTLRDAPEIGPARACGRVGGGVGASGRRAREPNGPPRLRRRFAPHVPRRGRPARPARGGGPGSGHRVHPHVDHGRRARRYQPSRRPRHLRRNADGSRPQRPGAERDDVLEPQPGMAVHLPGAPHRRRRDHLQPGAPQRGSCPGSR